MKLSYSTESCIYMEVYKMLFSPKEKGQGLVEYALILVLVSVVVLAVLLILGPIIGNVFTEINSTLENN